MRGEGREMPGRQGVRGDGCKGAAWWGAMVQGKYGVRKYAATYAAKNAAKYAVRGMARLRPLHAQP